MSEDLNMIDDPKTPPTPPQEPPSSSLPIDPSLTIYIEKGIQE